MPTNLAIDDNLIQEAQKLGRHRTKKEAVTAALDEYIKRRQQLEVLACSERLTMTTGTTTRKNEEPDGNECSCGFQDLRPRAPAQISLTA